MRSGDWYNLKGTNRTFGLISITGKIRKMGHGWHLSKAYPSKDQWLYKPQKGQAHVPNRNYKICLLIGIMIKACKCINNNWAQDGQNHFEVKAEISYT